MNHLDKEETTNSYTTGGGFFAECLRHSAKADIHSASALGKGRYTLGKAFAECYTR